MVITHVQQSVQLCSAFEFGPKNEETVSKKGFLRMFVPQTDQEKPNPRRETGRRGGEGFGLQGGTKRKQFSLEKLQKSPAKATDRDTPVGNDRAGVKSGAGADQGDQVTLGSAWYEPGPGSSLMCHFMSSSDALNWTGLLSVTIYEPHLQPRDYF